MGRDKASLPFRGGTLADAVSHAVREAAGSAVFVGNPPLGIPDLFPGEGPLGGILTALHHSEAEWNLIVACDMPEITADVLRQLLDRAEAATGGRAAGCDALLPCHEGKPEPLCAVYRLGARDTMERHFNSGVRKVTAALDGLTVVRLEIAEVRAFQNVNTPRDWMEYGAG